MVELKDKYKYTIVGIITFPIGFFAGAKYIGMGNAEALQQSLETTAKMVKLLIMINGG